MIDVRRDKSYSDKAFKNHNHAENNSFRHSDKDGIEHFSQNAEHDTNNKQNEGNPRLFSAPRNAAFDIEQYADGKIQYGNPRQNKIVPPFPFIYFVGIFEPFCKRKHLLVEIVRKNQ